MSVPPARASQLCTTDGRIRRDSDVVADVAQLLRGEPRLRHLGELRPHHADWGHSALHFTGRWLPAGIEVIVKVGVSPPQRWWTECVAMHSPELVPFVFATGGRLGSEPVGWVVLEMLPSGLHAGWNGVEFGLLMDAAVRFQRFGRAHPDGPRRKLGVGEVREWLETGIRRNAPGPADRLLDRLERDWEFLCRVCPLELCHGDLHMANVLSRTPAPLLSPAVLIDFEPCSMPWMLEAAYCQVMNSDPDRAGWQGLAHVMAERRRAYDMPVVRGTEQDFRRAEAIALGWFAVRAWAMLGPDTDPSWRAPETWRNANEAYVRAAVDHSATVEHA